MSFPFCRLMLSFLLSLQITSRFHTLSHCVEHSVAAYRIALKNAVFSVFTVLNESLCLFFLFKIQATWVTTTMELGELS